MAEGGKDEDQNNPFSFKSFISKKDKNKDERSNSTDADVLDIFDISDNASQKRREKSRPILLVEDGIFWVQYETFDRADRPRPICRARNLFFRFSFITNMYNSFFFYSIFCF